MLRLVAAAIAVGALVVCAGPAVAEDSCDGIVTIGDGVATSTDDLGEGAATSVNASNNGATASAGGPHENVATPADRPNDGVITSASAPNATTTPPDGLRHYVTTTADDLNDSSIPSADGPDDNSTTSVDGTDDTAATPTASPNDSIATSTDDPNDNSIPFADGPDRNITTSVDGTDDNIVTSPAASPHDPAVTPVGLAASLIRLGTRALALTVVPLHQFPAFDAVITHESGWDLFAINPQSGAYGLGQALPAEKMQTHGWDWRFNPLTQIRWTYDYMNERYGSPDGAWAFWQKHHWY